MNGFRMLQNINAMSVIAKEDCCEFYDRHDRILASNGQIVSQRWLLGLSLSSPFCTKKMLNFTKIKNTGYEKAKLEIV